MTKTARPKNGAYRALLGQRVRDLRSDRAISQETLALRCGISRRYMSGIERGEHNPTIDQLVRMAVGLEIQPRELLPDLPLAAT